LKPFGPRKWKTEQSGGYVTGRRKQGLSNQQPSMSSRNNEAKSNCGRDSFAGLTRVHPTFTQTGRICGRSNAHSSRSNFRDVVVGTHGGAKWRQGRAKDSANFHILLNVRAFTGNGSLRTRDDWDQRCHCVGASFGHVIRGRQMAAQAGRGSADRRGTASGTTSRRGEPKRTPSLVAHARSET